METGADVQAMFFDCLSDSAGTLDGPGRSIESGQRPVSGGLDVSASEAFELMLVGREA